jgi:hypothetical protein
MDSRKKIFLVLFYVLLNSGGMVLAQNSPIDFETGGYGATWTWTVFENGSNPSLEIVTNPNTGGINSSATVAKFTALQAGQPWAGCESLHGSDIGTFSLDATNSTLKIMVYKPVISDVGLKFVIPTGGSLGEIKVANTVTNAWEELTFDFSSHIGLPEAIGIDQIVVFPDFNLGGRTQDNIIYFDNITFSPPTGPGSPAEAAPTPTLAEANVISIFSDAYTNIDGVNLNPDWGQSTVVTEMVIEGNNTLLYTGLNYQGTEFIAQDVSGMTYLHIDYWTDNSTALNFFVISQTPTIDSDYHTFAIVSEQWVSVDIPLSTFPNVDLTDVFQFKVEGNGTIYWDNFYFYSNPGGVIDYQTDWNLVGLPLEVEDSNYQTIFPESTEGTLYSYNGEQYLLEEELQMGNGYWLHFENDGTTQLTGTPVNEITLQLNAGWNLISGISSVVGLAGISDPGDIVVPGTIFEFTDSYDYATLLTPGHGYWIYASTDGYITISSGNASKTNAFESKNLDKVNKLTVNGMELYFGVELSARDKLSHSLPPKPPADAFDVRFKDGWRVVKDYGEVEVMSTSETLTIIYDIKLNDGEHMNWVLSSESVDYILEDTGEITVPSAERFILELKAVVPATFTLYQNFPNPFNPITTLRYDLPSDAMVTLTVFDMLGREINQLVNTTQEEGFKSVQWDGTDSMGRPVSAGVYLYQIRAEEFVQTKKMVLLK